MAVLLIADVNEGALATDQVAKALDRRQACWARCMCWSPAPAAMRLRPRLRRCTACRRCCSPMTTPIATAWPNRPPLWWSGLAGGYSHICGAATAFNKNVLPRVAALLDVMVMSDVTAVIDADTFERPIYAGNAVQTVKSSTPKRCSRSGPPALPPSAPAVRRRSKRSADRARLGCRPGSRTAWRRRDRPELTRAGIVVSGGRGVGSQGKLRPDRRAGGQAERRCRCLARGGRFGLCAERLAGWADRQGRGAEPLCRGRDFRRHPAPGGHEGQQGHRRDQQG